MLANLVNSEPTAVSPVWETGLDGLFLHLLSSSRDAATITATTMMLHSCVRQRPEVCLADFAENNGGRRVFAALLDTMDYGWSDDGRGIDLDWCSYIVEILMQAEGDLFAGVYNGLNPELLSSETSPSPVASAQETARIVAADRRKLILLKAVMNCQQGEESACSQLSPRAIKFLCERFRLLGYLAEDEQWWLQEASRGPSFTLITVTSLLANAACVGDPDARTHIGSRGLVEKAVELLAKMRAWPKGARRPRGKDATETPAFGMEREIVKLIGNISFETKVVQDRVREFGGLPIVLSSMVHDDANPFIREWAIVAVRNLMRGNPENQALLAALEKQPQGLTREEVRSA